MKKRYKILLVIVVASFIFGIVKYGQRGLPVYDAMDFIGVGQGDTVSAINAAIQVAAANTPSVVYVPEGAIGIANAYRSGTTYRPLGIIGASGVTLRGAGINATTLVQDAPPAGATFDTTSYATNTHWAPIITCTNCTNFRVENLSINGTLSRQINHTSNPYTTDPIADSSRVDAIRIVGGNNNSIYRVRIDSIQFYGVQLNNAFRTSVDHIHAATCIMGGVYMVGTCNNSALTNSIITNNNCDNVRLRTGYVDIINNEISWSKFNPGVGGASFAGIYIENDGGVNPQTVGVNIVGNRIHDNSSFAVDVFNVDTTNWTLTGPVASVRNNEMYRNANGGVQLQMQWVGIDGNDIYDNGQDSLGIQDPVAYTGWGVITHGLNSNGASVTNNAFRTTSPPGKQLYAIGMGSATAIPIFSVHGNTVFGGLDLLNTGTASLKSTFPYNTYYGNTIMDSNKLVRSDWTTDNNGAVYMYNHAPGLNGIASGTLNLVGDNDAGITGIHLGNTVRAFYISGNGSGLGAELGFKIGSYGAGSGIAARTLGFYDFQTSALRGAMNAAGDLYWGTAFSSTNYSFVIHQPGTALGGLTVPSQMELQTTGNGTTSSQFQTALVATFNPGYTGANGSTGGIKILNTNANTSNAIGGLGSASGNFGIFSQAAGATSGASIGVMAIADNALSAVGVLGDASLAQLNNASAKSIGVLGYALRGNASAIEIGGYFGLQNAQPTFASAAIVADNGAESVPVALFRVNGVTKIQIDASGNLIPGAATTTDLGTAATFYRDIYFSHTVGETAIGVSSGLGTNVSSLTPAGNDEDFQITVVTSGNVSGTVGLVAFGRTWGATPHCIISVANAATGTAVTGGYYGINATSASSMTVVGSFTGAGTYIFQCHCGQ